MKTKIMLSCLILLLSGCVTVHPRDEYTIQGLGDIEKAANEQRLDAIKELKAAGVVEARLKALDEAWAALGIEINALATYEKAKENRPK